MSFLGTLSSNLFDFFSIILGIKSITHAAMMRFESDESNGELTGDE